MFMTKKINKDTVAVLFGGVETPSISLRKSGKAYIGHEEGAIYLCEDKIVINKPVIEKYGLKLVVRGE